MEEVMQLDEQQKRTLQQGVSQVMRQVDGRGARAREAQRQSILEAHRLTGTAPAATIINFNPVDIFIENGGLNLRVPAFCAKPQPKRIQYKLDNRTFIGAYLTIENPKVYPSIREVNTVEGRDEPDYDLKTCLPIAMVHELWAAANSSMTDSAAKGGVVIFEGDIRAFEKAMKAEVPTLRVPTFSILPDRTRQYYCEQRQLNDLFKGALDTMHRYTEMQIQQAQSYHTTEGQQNYITPIHRLWHQFALDMGWKSSPANWMIDSGEPAETCVGCGRGRKVGVKAFFCECGRPYNPFEAFMAGEPVGEVYLSALKGKELDTVLKEMKRRKALFADTKEPKQGEKAAE